MTDDEITEAELEACFVEVGQSPEKIGAANVKRKKYEVTGEQKARYAENRKEWAKKNPDRVRAASLKYRGKNKDKCNETAKSWRKRNPDKVRAVHVKHRDKRVAKTREWHTKNKQREREWYRKHKYGLAPGEFDKMVKQQGGCCLICETEFGLDRASWPHIDHCHSTGAIRGLLCSHCNQGIGHFKDNPELLILAAEYVRQASLKVVSE